MKPFTIVLPVRATEQELRFLDKSLPSAIKLSPDEIMIGMDENELMGLIVSKVKKICERHGFDFNKITLVSRKKDNEWGFQLANIIWHCYKAAKYDTILSFDVDSVLRKEVMLGLDQVGVNDVAVVSFTKRLKIKTPAELIRYMFYRLRVRQSDYVFSGVYWIWRPFFFNIIKLDAYKKIINGVDTLLTEVILADKKYKIITRKEKGVNCMTPQNEDYPWRQFQTGIWIHANSYIPTHSAIVREHHIRNWRNVTIGGIIKLTLYLMLKPLLKTRASVRSELFVLVKALTYMHPYLIKGFYWARDNPNHQSVKMAKQLSYNEWGYLGSKYLPDMKWKTRGTGFYEI